MPTIPNLKILDDEVKRFNLPVNLRSFRVRAMRLGACYRIGRKLYVTADQLIQIIESWVSYPPCNIRQPSTKVRREKVLTSHDRLTRVLKTVERWQREAEKKRRDANKSRRQAMKEYWRTERMRKQRQQSRAEGSRSKQEKPNG